jgi:hypothetical protein
MASRCKFPTFAFSFSFPIPMISIPFPKLPTLPSINLFCPLD